MPSTRGLRLLLVLAAVTGLLAAPAGAIGAIGTSITVSPTLGEHGQLIEVQLRTYVPVPASALDLEVPADHPAPTGLLSVLFPFPDYPFRVTATGPDGAGHVLMLTPDPADLTLRRGWLRPDDVGRWVMRIENGTPGTPGSSAEMLVAVSGASPVATSIAQPR